MRENLPLIQTTYILLAGHEHRECMTKDPWPRDDTVDKHSGTDVPLFATILILAAGMPMGVTFSQWRGESDHRSRMSGRHVQIYGLEDEAPREVT